MRFFNLTLTAAEAEAYNAALLKRSQSISPLWKLHADALVVLLEIASTTTEEAGSVAKIAESKEAEAAKAIRETVQKLRTRCDLAVKALAHPGN